MTLWSILKPTVYRPKGRGAILTLIIYIALGIVLGFLILAYFQEIIALALILVGLGIAALVVGGAGYYIYSLATNHQQKAQTVPAAVPTTAPVIALPAQVTNKKKYLLVFPSGQIYQLEAAEDATAQELQAEVKRAVNGRDVWMDVAVTSDGAAVYADLSSFGKLGSVARMSWLMDYQASPSPPRDHASVKMDVAHDCSNMQMQILSAYQYPNYMGTGDGSRVGSQITRWLPVPTDGGQLEKMWKFACR